MWVATKQVTDCIKDMTISTHATHVGGDVSDSLCNGIYTTFQLTPPMWVATLDTETYKGLIGISTHATHVGGDEKTEKVHGVD